YYVLRFHVRLMILLMLFFFSSRRRHTRSKWSSDVCSSDLDLPEELLGDLAEEASARWSEPWVSAALHGIDSRTIVGIPIKEYVRSEERRVGKESRCREELNVVYKKAR